AVAETEPPAQVASSVRASWPFSRVSPATWRVKISDISRRPGSVSVTMTKRRSSRRRSCSTRPRRTRVLTRSRPAPPPAGTISACSARLRWPTRVVSRARRCCQGAAGAVVGRTRLSDQLLRDLLGLDELREQLFRVDLQQAHP